MSIPRRQFRRITLVLGITGAYLVAIQVLLIAERSSARAKITSWGDAVWYTLVTLTTVGYGDLYPITPVGRAIGIFFLLGTLGVLGLLIAKVTEIVGELREKRRMGMYGTQMSNHIVIIGWNSIARAVTRQLLNADRQVAIIADSRDGVDLIHQEFDDQPVFVLFASAQSVELFHKAGISSASMVFVNLGDDTQNLITVLNTKARFPDRSFVVMLENPDLRATFSSAGVTYTISPSEIASTILASYLFEPDVARFETEILSATSSAGDYDMQQYLVSDHGPYVGSQYGDVLNDLRTNFRCLPVGLSRVDGDSRRLLKLPPDETVIEAGDFLIVITDGDGELHLSRHMGVREGI